MLLLARAAVLRYRRHFINCTFPFVWTGFTLLSAAAMLVVWALHCIVSLTFFDLRATVFRAVLTIAIRGCSIDDADTERRWSAQ